MRTKPPHPVDIHVGQRLKQQRKLKNISQEKLGEQLGVTFQQIQKYENATNRISASKLYELSQILQTPIQFFFENYQKSPQPTEKPNNVTTKELNFTKRFRQLNPAQQQAFTNLINKLTNEK
ncbi:MAG: helix-turn-helix transcriptional regulator [Alphaproteobacteria bacterium]|nr:helix-turn-helix transcriptional regulator [Alphaproteobacteria bacterium]MDD9920307.1 helix-turn-helix transcriptional regulator [Alphaproteobacteria bacterium]